MCTSVAWALCEFYIKNSSYLAGQWSLPLPRADSVITHWRVCLRLVVLTKKRAWIVSAKAVAIKCKTKPTVRLGSRSIPYSSPSFWIKLWLPALPAEVVSIIWRWSPVASYADSDFTTAFAMVIWHRALLISALLCTMKMKVCLVKICILFLVVWNMWPALQERGNNDTLIRIWRRASMEKSCYYALTLAT